jgi:hypothetical protein
MSFKYIHPTANSRNFKRGTRMQNQGRQTFGFLFFGALEIAEGELLVLHTFDFNNLSNIQFSQQTVQLFSSFTPHGIIP